MQMYDMHLAAGMPGHSYIWRTMALCRQKRNIDGVALRKIFFCARIFFCILELPRGRCGLLQQDINYTVEERVYEFSRCLYQRS